ncbi:alanine racemase [Cellulomonas bogoriensis]|uniref:Alanine racemase n=1 Tax=Cellulomonas bogoriensis 69B4 = DSM 16987 TaxID=1386082 RepID=A0A0A0BPD8_9CELL|nr:alanine racemase [Cellulomonas bogoriensis]KGM09537.1 alanine racemase [Cellulomonas bogoriensis 69B4 = DSM 16987]
MSPYPARAVIDLGAISDNVRALDDRSGAAQVMAVVKADAYGHGLVPSALAALAGGATWLGVAQITEALALRAAGVTAPVLTWLYAPGAPLAEVVTVGVDVSVAAGWAAHEVVAAARAAGVPARVHVKVDTGLGRGGVMPADLEELLEVLMAAQAEGLCVVVGVWSHLAWADAPAHPTVLQQAAVFDEACRTVERAGARLEVRHLANSAATLTDPAMHYDLVRPGISVFGLSPVPELGGPADFGLRPAMRLEADLALVKDVPAGHGISYGHDYVTPAATRVGLVPLGYADGIPRHASGTRERWGGPVQVGGRRLGVAGRVCMDQVVLDLGADAPERAGDTVVLFGDGTDGGPTAHDWADVVGTISYEIVTRVGARVPRTHVGAVAP